MDKKEMNRGIIIDGVDLRSQIFFNCNYKDGFYYLYTLTKK